MQINDEYDIGKAFEAIEDELMASMIRNLEKHKQDEVDEKKEWSMWQTEQLKSLEEYRKANQKKFGKQFQTINQKIDYLIRLANADGQSKQEAKILEAIKKGFPGKKPAGSAAEFFKINDRKLDALIKATSNDMEKAEIAVLRRADDQYRKIIYNAQVYANTGAGTYEKAVDMAAKDFLSKGLDCIEYANGARHTLEDYADMAIRTACKRAYLQGEGVKRQEWGLHLVIVNKRGNPCPKCLPFCGKVLIDDVWSGGSREDGEYPLMSAAVDAGLYHPRCRDSHTTYFPGITTADGSWTKEELEAIGQNTKDEARQQYAERQAKKFGRLAEYSLDPENKKKYAEKEKEWKQETKDVEQTDAYSDITTEYIKHENNSGEVIDAHTYSINGTTYEVDGKNVLLDYSKKEKQIAELLKKYTGGEIAMIPRVLNPQGISTPDYTLNGEAFDLKELMGESKNLVYNALSKKKKQASNFVLDISDCPLDEKEIYRQINDVYRSRHTTFIDKIILVKNEKVIRILKRKNKEK